MPAFPDRESSLLNKLYETAPWTAKLHQQDQEAGSEGVETSQPVVNGVTEPTLNIGLPVDTVVTSKTILSDVFSFDSLSPPSLS